MTALTATFSSGFSDPCKFRVKDRELRRVSYATVLELEYMPGLKCAGMKINESLLLRLRQPGDASQCTSVRRLREKCFLLNQICHPNLVQFLGVSDFRQGPILVMEFLSTNLTSCIEKHGILPKEISYSILHDVALGLCYLHNRSSPIVHRDLSSNNVLLTPNMTAKISDLGVAGILNLTPLEISNLTQTPSTRTFMSPEVMVVDAKYNTSVDVFSYGIMMIHILSGQWPEPPFGLTHIEPYGGPMIPESEAKQRVIQVNEKKHLLINLLHRCINNEPQMRPHATEIAMKVDQEASKFPASFANKLEMLKKIEAVEVEKRALTEEGESKDRAIQTLTREGERKDRDIRQKERELEAKIRALEEKDTTISAMSEQLKKQQILEATIIWNQSLDLPHCLSNEKAVVLHNKLYCGGGTADNFEDEYTIYCYDSSQDEWTTLPPLPVYWFGLGRVNEKLVAIGGVKKSNQVMDVVYTYDEQSQKWQQTIPPMPTARYAPGVLSLQSTLVVAGGYKTLALCVNTVEVFKSDASQWQRADPLPMECSDISLVAVDNRCYALGGYNGSSLNQALFASVDDLLGSGNSEQSAWKILQNIPAYEPAAAVLAGKLLAVGGKETPCGRSDKKEVYMYCPSTNSWMYVSDLPIPRSRAAVAMLSSTNILVIGGWYKGHVNSVYRGILHLN